MTADAHERHRDATGAYLLGALPELEAKAFERHLMGCAACRAEVERLRPAVEALPLAVTPLNAPDSVRRSLIAAVEAEARPAEQPAGRPRPARLAAARARLGTLAPRIRPTLAWASAAFLLAGGVVAGYGASQLVSDEGDERRIPAVVDESRLAEASGSLLVGESEDRAVLTVHGVPALPDEDTAAIYQLWLVHGSELTPSSLLSVGTDGSGAATIPEGVDEADAVWVTRERLGGARAPTEQPVMRVALD